MKRIAVPLAPPGGKVAIFEVANAGRIPDGVIPSLINGSSVMDFTWDPFNDCRLMCGLDDGNVTVWGVPDTGLTQPVNTPDLTIPAAHDDKVTMVKCHPLAQGIMATAGQDNVIKVWNIRDKSAQEVTALTGHTDQIYSISWSQCGRFIASACKDGKIRYLRIVNIM